MTQMVLELIGGFLIAFSIIWTLQGLGVLRWPLHGFSGYRAAEPETQVLGSSSRNKAPPPGLPSTVSSPSIARASRREM